MTFAPGRNGVSLSTARPRGISGAPKLHSRVKPTKSICPFQYLEIINSSKLRYYKRKLLVNLFSHRPGWIWSLQAPGTLKGQGGHFILPRIPDSLVDSPQGDTHTTIGQKKKTKSRQTYQEREMSSPPPPLVPSEPQTSLDYSGSNNPPAADQHPNQPEPPPCGIYMACSWPSPATSKSQSDQLIAAAGGGQLTFSLPSSPQSYTPTVG